MTAPVFIFPIAPRQNFSDPAWREQSLRECRAQIGWEFTRPPRTRPLLAVDNTRPPPPLFLIDGMLLSPNMIAHRHLREFEQRARDSFYFGGLRDAFSDDTQPSQR